MRPSPPSRRRSQLPPNTASTSARLPVVTQMLCGQLLPTPAASARPAWTALRDRAAANNSAGTNTPSIILSPDATRVRAPR